MPVTRSSLKGLFPWCISTYAIEIHNHLKNKERQDPKVRFNAPQLKHRPVLIHWIRALSASLKLSTNTVHLGIKLIDIFMDRHDSRPETLPSICLICLVLAAKFEEEDSMIPKLSELPSYVNEDISKEVFVFLEGFVLQSFDWFVGFVTAANFAEYYSVFAIVNGDSDHFGTPHRHLQDVVQSSMRDFLDISLTELYMHEFLPSQVGACCLLAARIEHGIKPVWPKALSDVTGYNFSDLRDCLNLLFEANAFYSSKPFEAPRSESGYESSSPQNLCKKRKLDDS